MRNCADKFYFDESAIRAQIKAEQVENYKKTCSGKFVQWRNDGQAVKQARAFYDVGRASGACL